MIKLFENPALLTLLAAALLVFGPKTLPDLGRVIGESIRAVREGLTEKDEEDVDPSHGSQK